MTQSTYDDDYYFDIADEYDSRIKLRTSSSGSTKKKKKPTPLMPSLPKEKSQVSKTIDSLVLPDDFSDEFHQLNSKSSFEFVVGFNEILEAISKSQHYRKTIYTTNVDKLIKLAEESAEFSGLIKNIKYIKKLDSTKDPYQLDYVSNGLILFIRAS
jgi:hypothetical protein